MLRGARHPHHRRPRLLRRLLTGEVTDLHSGPAAIGTGVRSRPRAARPALCATQCTR
ncbi:MFS transporter, partial [Streptomyces sp. NPDC054956]